MGNQKLFFRSEWDDTCHTLEFHVQEAINQGLHEIELYESIPHSVVGHWWCKEHFAIIEPGDCGKKICEQYDPINGINGKCKHKRGFTMPGKKVKVDVKSGKIIK